MGTRDNPRGDEAVRISVVFSVVGSIVVLFRLYVRLVIVRTPGLEDLSITIAMLFANAFTVLVKVQADAGMGIHQWDLTSEEVLGPLKSLFASILCYYLTFAFVKASLLLQYYRVFTVRRMQIAIYAVGAFVLLYSIETILLTVFLCMPVEKFWIPSLSGTCLDRRPLWFTNSALHIATDVAIILLPMPQIKHLNIPQRQKRALIILFAMGGFACATSIVRLRSLIQITSENDLTYDNANTATWSAGELNISLVCASLPAMRPLFIRLMPRLLGVSSPSSAEGNSKATSRGKQGSGATGQSRRFYALEEAESEIVGYTQPDRDDKILLQSKCWAQPQPGRDETWDNWGRGQHDRQIMVLTDISYHVQKQDQV